MEESQESNVVELATELTIAWLSNPNTRANANEVPEFLQAMHQAVLDLAKLGQNAEPAEDATPYIPAVTARRSLSSPDHIISLIDGRRYKTLRWHLSRHGLTPEQYRERYGLKPDYPMVAPAYSETRRAMAHKIGLGQKGRTSRTTGSEARAAKPGSTRGRKPKSSKAE